MERYEDDSTPSDLQEVNLGEIIYKYLSYWPWFVLSTLVCVSISLAYLIYTPNTYESSTKIRILDKKQTLELPTENLFGEKINLENEIETISSFPVIERVIKKLNLCSEFFLRGKIKNIRALTVPFTFELTVPLDSLIEDQTYDFDFHSQGLSIYSYLNDSTYFFKNQFTTNTTHDLPFEILPAPLTSEKKITQHYTLFLTSLYSKVNQLKELITISSVGKKSEVIKISMRCDNTVYAENILNTLVNVYNMDGIDDRRLIHKKTIDFINDRFVSLSYELDSIELQKQLFKYNNNLVNIKVDANLSQSLRSESDKTLFDLENQISIAKLLLKNVIADSSGSLLPANIGLESQSINNIIGDFNQNILRRKSLSTIGGENNPSVKILNSSISDQKENISQSLVSYLEQLEETRQQLIFQNKKYSGLVSSLPEKEKKLRSIERSQEIQESLYLFLLQRREEAEVNFAITESSIKVVEYAISEKFPISPNKKVIVILGLLFGLLIPFSTLYLIFLFDTKLHLKKDLEFVFPNHPILSEIPDIKDVDNKIFKSPNNRSTIAEASRILASNTHYLLGKDEKNKTCKVIITTSTIKGEGKTFVALNLSLALASLNKKVLLVGADLRNPQIHNYINVKKSSEGLTNYLYDKNFVWKSAVKNYFEDLPTHNVLIGGAIAPNPVQLLTNGNLETFLNEAKKSYDYIVLDCAPTLLVTDTLLISQFADATVYLTRANFSEKELLEFPKKLIEEQKLKNVGFVLNGLGSGKAYGYGYGYAYGYKYGYNYGYGYGYDSGSKS